jgi:hypothetical protein
MLESLLVGETK